jgi:uncharacterized protein YjbI with pentapeptide repeats
MKSRIGELWRAIARWRVRRWFTPARLIGSGLLAAAIVLSITFYINRLSHRAGVLDDALLVTLYVTAAIVLGLDWLTRRRIRREEILRQQHSILKQMASPVNDIALAALRIAKWDHWHKDGTLQGVILRGANLQGAVIPGANLQAASFRNAYLGGIDLTEANLASADFEGARMQYARLGAANLRGAILIGADLQHASLLSARLDGAKLRGANLQWSLLRAAHLEGADLSQANLRHANLISAYLRGADFTDTHFSGETLLPDGSNWAKDADVSRFTDPRHPRFWQRVKLE